MSSAGLGPPYKMLHPQQK